MIRGESDRGVAWLLADGLDPCSVNERERHAGVAQIVEA
jgi:hypothetical protein